MPPWQMHCRRTSNRSRNKKTEDLSRPAKPVKMAARTKLAEAGVLTPEMTESVELASTTADVLLSEALANAERSQQSMRAENVELQTELQLQSEKLTRTVSDQADEFSLQRRQLVDAHKKTVQAARAELQAGPACAAGEIPCRKRLAPRTISA